MHLTWGHGRLAHANALLAPFRLFDQICLPPIVSLGLARPCMHAATRGVWTDTPPEDTGSTFYDSTIEQVQKLYRACKPVATPLSSIC